MEWSPVVGPMTVGSERVCRNGGGFVVSCVIGGDLPLESRLGGGMTLLSFGQWLGRR